MMSEDGSHSLYSSILPAAVLEVVSPAVLLVDEGRVVLSGVDTRVSGPGESGIRVQAIPLDVRVTQSGRIIDVGHLQEVLGAPVLLHFDGLPPPIGGALGFRVLGVRGHLEVAALEDEFADVVFALPAAGDGQSDAEDEEEPPAGRRYDHRDQLVWVGAVESSQSEGTSHTDSILKLIAVITSSAGAVRCAVFEVSGLTLALGNAGRVGALRRLIVTSRVLQFAQTDSYIIEFRVEDELARRRVVGGGLAPLFVALDVVSQVIQGDVGGEEEDIPDGQLDAIP